MRPASRLHVFTKDRDYHDSYLHQGAYACCRLLACTKNFQWKVLALPSLSCMKGKRRFLSVFTLQVQLCRHRECVYFSFLRQRHKRQTAMVTGAQLERCLSESSSIDASAMGLQSCKEALPTLLLHASARKLTHSTSNGTLRLGPGSPKSPKRIGNSPPINQ